MFGVVGGEAVRDHGDDHRPDIPLLTNVDKGGISPAQPRPSTDAQETVLDIMRQSLRRSGASAAD